MKLAILTAFLTIISAQAAWADSKIAYQTSGVCDGFARANVQSAPGTCLGLVAAHLGFPRGVTEIGEDVYLTDMGGWRKGHGRVLRLGHGGRDAPQVLLDHLDEPDTITPAPNGWLYVGLLDRIVRFDPKAASLKDTVSDVITNLPGTGRHPLPVFVVGRDGSLFVNVGSATDNCETEAGDPPDAAKPCPETQARPPRASILHVVLHGDAPVDARTVPPYATGLRNSMALALLPSGQLMAAVNARDSIDKADPSLPDEEFPHDTLVRVVQGVDYGWPYCFDNDRPAPEYKDFDCGLKTAPDLLLPPHAAPLGMIDYRGNGLPGLEGKLVIGYHGYRKYGHRIVALAVDAQGHPQGETQDVVWDWADKPGSHPSGFPVTLFQQADGSILITEDADGTLVRLSRLAG